MCTHGVNDQTARKLRINMIFRHNLDVIKRKHVRSFKSYRLYLEMRKSTYVNFIEEDEKSTCLNLKYRSHHRSHIFRLDT